MSVSWQHSFQQETPEWHEKQKESPAVSRTGTTGLAVNFLQRGDDRDVEIGFGLAALLFRVGLGSLFRR